MDSLFKNFKLPKRFLKPNKSHKPLVRFCLFLCSWYEAFLRRFVIHLLLMLLYFIEVKEYVIKAQILAGGRGLGVFDNGFKGGVQLTTEYYPVLIFFNADFEVAVIS